MLRIHTWVVFEKLSFQFLPSGGDANLSTRPPGGAASVTPKWKTYYEFWERTTSLHILNFAEKAAEQQLLIHTLSFNRTSISTRHIPRVLSAFKSLIATRINYNWPLNIQHVNIQFAPGGRQNMTLTHLNIFSFNTGLRNAGQFPLAMREFTNYGISQT
ncbi:hypothetical protein BDA99DRAFT_542521 [Phascolomyces articulosus]|uniref:Uncharacterized protein n=1 Tax=Phascolomyces articulosus TaxID=60185 RepID=A0AAD5JZU7_9FUNG|nr:hypothetical protein BDA99DRAFT_542521 [Phascolomyces articulosus]